MERDELCSSGKVFVEDERYVLSRYEVAEQDLYLMVWNETFESTPMFQNEKFKQKAWDGVLLDTTKLQLKIIDKLEHEYVGEVMLMKIDTETPELGIQLLRKYQEQGIGTRVMNLFVDKLKSVLQIDFFVIRIISDNYVSQKMFEKMGAVKIGEERKEYAEMMRKIMQNFGDKFEEVMKEDFEKTQRYIIWYKLEV